MESKLRGLSKIEWICIIAIIAVLALIASPSFLVSEVCAATGESIGKHIVGSMSRAQQAYYFNHGYFMSSIPQIEKELGVVVRNDYWEISTQTKGNVAFSYARAKNVNQKLYSYVAATAYDKGDSEYSKIICRTVEPTTFQAAAPTLQGSQQFIFWHKSARLTCPSGTKDC